MNRSQLLRWTQAVHTISCILFMHVKPVKCSCVIYATVEIHLKPRLHVAVNKGGLASKIFTCLRSELWPWMNGNVFSLWNMNKALFMLVKCLYNKQNNTWSVEIWNFSSYVQIDISWVSAGSSEVLSWTLKEKFHTSKRPSITGILYIIHSDKGLTLERE